jgi:hypothetical protein
MRQSASQLYNVNTLKVTNPTKYINPANKVLGSNSPNTPYRTYPAGHRRDGFLTIQPDKTSDTRGWFTKRPYSYTT